MIAATEATPVPPSPQYSRRSQSHGLRVSLDRSRTFALRRDEVHVWFADLRRLGNWERFLVGLLSPAELERAGRFRFARDRVAFTLSRGSLRALLGCYLELDPARIDFVYGAYGKPALSCGDEENDLHFNVAHSADVAVFALARGRRIGVDVELVRDLDDRDALAARFFAPDEAAALQALSGAHRTRAFFDCWTRKEAFVKALGSGLAYPLDRFTVSLAPGEPAQLRGIRGDESYSRAWWMGAFEPAGGYTGAVVLDQPPSAVRYRHMETNLFELYGPGLHARTSELAS